MSFRRVSSVLGKILLLTLLVSFSGCKKKVDNSPHIVNRLPLAFAGSVAHFPLMVLDWDRALNPATLGGNVIIFNTDQLGTPTTVWGPGGSLTYLAGSSQVVIKNNAAFTKNTEYCVLVFPGLETDKGVPVNADPLGSMALLFTVGDSGNANPVVFPDPAQNVGAGGAGQIVWTWTQAQGNNPLVNIAATYEFYMSLTLEGEDLFDNNPPFLSTNNIGGITMSGLTTGTTYHFRVICRDGQGNILLTGPLTAVPD